MNKYLVISDIEFNPDTGTKATIIAKGDSLNSINKDYSNGAVYKLVKVELRETE